jgi:hypothetical protein
MVLTRRGGNAVTVLKWGPRSSRTKVQTDLRTEEAPSRTLPIGHPAENGRLDHGPGFRSPPMGGQRCPATLSLPSLSGGVMTVIAQQKPDFSGEWKLNLQGSTLSPIVARAAQSGVLRIEHHEPRFKAHQIIVLDGKPVESKFELLSDGREVVTDAGGRRIVSTLLWNRDALVVTWRIHSPEGEVTISFRYEVHGDGRQLRAAEQLRGGGRDQDNLWLFERP